MPDADEMTELRSLQERAYGRDGGLSDDEAARLRELERTAGDEGEAPASPVQVEGRASEGGLAAEAPAETEPSSRRPDGPASALRTHGALLAVVLVAAIGAGLLAGWLLFAHSAPQGMPLDTEQQGWQEEILVSGVYDRGSLRAVAAEDGAVVWFATRDGGETVCAIIGDGVTTSPACRNRALALLQGVHTSLRRAVEGGENQVDAQMLLDAEGDPAVVTSNYLIGVDLDNAYANAAEQRTAESLIDEGYAPTSLAVVGYDGDVPIWTGMTIDDGRWCLIYRAPSSPAESVCDGQGPLFNDGGVLRLVRQDADAGASTTFEYRFGPGSPYLQITRSSDGAAS